MDTPSFVATSLEEQLSYPMPKWHNIQFEHGTFEYKFKYVFDLKLTQPIFFVWNYEKYFYPLIDTGFFMMREKENNDYRMCFSPVEQYTVNPMLVILGQAILKANNLHK